VVAAAAVWFFFINERADAPTPDQQTTEPQASEETPPYAAPDLQPVIDSWVGAQRASYHIAVYDHQAGRVIAKNEPDEALFAASLYKIYVAYLALLDFQTGAQNPDDILVAGQTKKECVDKMIRSSDSPCGEAIMAE